jgi:excisionase family DNA binding protein
MSGEISKATYTVDEAAKKLGIGRNHAYEACHSGDLPSIRIGKRLLIPAAALDRLLDGAVVSRGRAE